jgi:hypothetical protein
MQFQSETSGLAWGACDAKVGDDPNDGKPSTGVKRRHRVPWWLLMLLMFIVFLLSAEEIDGQSLRWPCG